MCVCVCVCVCVCAWKAGAREGYAFSCDVLDDYGSVWSMCVAEVIRNANGFPIGLRCFVCYCCFAVVSE